MIVSFNPEEGLIIIPTRLYGPQGDIITRLALDTGATRTTINTKILAILGYNAQFQLKHTKLLTGSGTEFVAKLNLNKIQAFSDNKKNFTVLCHTLPSTTTVDGVLGLDFLRKSRLLIDFKKGKVKYFQSKN